MITLADIGDYGFLLVMLIFGLINWLANKVKEGKAAPPPRPVARAPQPRETAPQTRTAEEERMRRFLEALGVPTDQAPPPAPAPAARPEPRRPRLVPRAPRPAPVERRAMPPPLPPPAERSLDEAETTSEPVERIHLPELQTAQMPEFQTVSSRVSADSDEEFRTVSAHISAVPSIAPLAEHKRETEAVSSTLLAALRTPASLRHAFVLREILGPPRSMQRGA